MLSRVLLAALFAGSLSAHAEPLKLKLHAHRPSAEAGKRDLLKRDGTPVRVGNNAINYFFNVTIGDQTFNMMADTGSSNVWIGANKTFVPKPGAVNTHREFEITYGSGYVNGTQWTDSVSIGGLTVANQSFGVSAYEEGYGYQGIDGIFGLGGIWQTNNTVDGSQLVPTWMNNLYAQGTIEQEVLGVYFAPLGRGEAYAINGELTIGGIDPARYVGDITYVPTSQIGGRVASWVVRIDAVTADGQELGKGGYGAVIDTGSTNIYVPVDAYFPWLNLTGGVWDQTHFLSRFAEKPNGTFGFTIGGTSFELTPEQYLVPEDQYHVWGLPEGVHWSFISTAGPTNFYIGQKFIENIYTVYDTTNLRMGFAPAKHAGSDGAEDVGV